jgi:uncharacterized membrane protein
MNERVRERATQSMPETSGQASQGIRPRFDIESLVGYILLAGVLSSITLILAGLLWHLARTGEVGIQYSIADVNFFQFLVQDVRQILAGELRPRLLVSLGIALLMLTPFVRVVASMMFFLVAERNWKYTAFTAFVLAILTYSLFLR